MHRWAYAQFSQQLHEQLQGLEEALKPNVAVAGAAVAGVSQSLGVGP